MSLVRDGIPASPGIVVGPAYVLHWEIPVMHGGIVAPEDVEREVERFEEAREWAKQQVREVQRKAAERLGPVEAKIFDPQLMMLDDVDLVAGTHAYIRDNRFSAARAFALRVLEFQSAWRRSGHPMVIDRLSDLLDIEFWVAHRLAGLNAPTFDIGVDGRKVILVARDLTPTLMIQIDRDRLLGIATDTGSRTSHTALLARSLNLPAVVGLGDLSTHVETGQELILDGRAGRVIVRPTERERALYRERDVKAREWEQELVLLAHMEAVTPDRQPVLVRANIDLPSEAEAARAHGAQGVGLFRTEFLAVGRTTEPEEEEQYQAYRRVAEAFPNQAVYIRTFDLGGDKFPLFLPMPAEENPFLGWRAIRVCLDLPDLFRTQLRALLRATAHGDVRIMLPMINDIEEIQRTRELLEEEEEKVRAEGIPYNPGYKLGIMIETPAAALNSAELARYADFFSIGTNDLVQYTLAVDRGNARLARLYRPFHPGVLKLLRMVSDAGRAAGIEVSVCGELAANPLGVFLLLGLGITALSVSPASLPEIKKIIRTVPAAEARAAVAEAMRMPTAQAAEETLTAGISRWLDLSLFSGRWNLLPPE